MPSDIEKKIKDYVRSQGVNLVGIAGPERLDGPPSLDPTYVMRGAKSVVCMALPMDVGAIYDFLSKKTPVTHNIDQRKQNQKLYHIAARTAEYIRSLGFKAKAVQSNLDYRRSLDVLSTCPSFSHRFGAIATGIGGQGLSGNIVTKEHGAAVYLGTVVTDAVLKSDPMLPPRQIMDNYCKKCAICDKACPVGMFGSEQEEYVLLNGELHPRGKRRNIDLCKTSCFGLHGLSMDRKWSSWGTLWIDEWVKEPPDPSKWNIRIAFVKKGFSTGDSAPRYELIRVFGYYLYPEKWFGDPAVFPDYQDLPEDELEQNKILSERMEKYLGIKVDNTNVLTCGQCALVCGPDARESARRLKALREGGIVVQDEQGRVIRAKTFEEAVEIRNRYPRPVSRSKIAADAIKSLMLFHRLYFGIEPRSLIGNWLYQKKLRRAMGNRSPSVSP